MFPPTMAYAIARIQHTEDISRADTRRRARVAGRRGRVSRR